jgi:hypothetical protein
LRLHLVAVLHEPSGRLGEDENADDEDDGKEDLWCQYV